MKKSSKIVTGLFILVGIWLWTILVWTEPAQLNSDSRPVHDLTKSQKAALNSLFMGNLKTYTLYSETEGDDAHTTSVAIHLNEVKAAQKAFQAALTTRKIELKNSWRKGDKFKKDVSETYTLIVIENCEYITFNLNNLNIQEWIHKGIWTHKGNCTNPIHLNLNPDDLAKMKKLLNSPLLKNILNQ